MNQLYPFARLLAETMCRVRPEWQSVKSLTCASQVRSIAQVDWEDLVRHGWTQKDHEALAGRLENRYKEPEPQKWEP